MQMYYENWKKSAASQLAQIVSDPEGLLTGNGFISGVYMLSFVNQTNGTVIPAYIGQAGVVPTAPSYVSQDCYERILQHLKRWLGNGYLTYWTGLNSTDNDWKIKIQLLEEENSQAKRLELETSYINRYKPLLQDTAGGKFELYPTKYGYSRNDLCIHPWKGQRRAAFLDRVSLLQSEN